MAEARDGHCTACHVRLRPQMANDVRRGERLVQCESCTRILYIVPPKPASPDAQQPPRRRFSASSPGDDVRRARSAGAADHSKQTAGARSFRTIGIEVREVRHRAEPRDVDVRGIQAGGDQLIVVGRPPIESQAIVAMGIGREPSVEIGRRIAAMRAAM